MIKYWLSIGLAMYLMSTALFGQNQNAIDSLHIVLKDQYGGDRFPALYELAFEYFDKDTDQALHFIQLAEEAAIVSGDSLWVVKSKRVKGQILYRMERIEECVKILENVLPTALRNAFSMESTLITSTLGSSYLFAGKFDRALQYYFQSLQLSKSSKDSADVAGGLNNIGLAYYKLSDYKKALRYYKESLDLQKARGKVEQRILTNISLCYAYLSDFASARRYLEESLSACGLNCPPRSIMFQMFASGLIYFGLKQFEEADRDFRHSYSLSITLLNSRLQLDNIYFLTEIRVILNRIPEAEGYLREAEKIAAKSIPFNMEMIKLYSRFYEVYLAIPDYKRASDYQKKYIQLRDSIYSHELTTNLMRVESELLERENEAKIEAQVEVIKLKEDVIRQQKALNVITIFLTLVTASFLILLFRNYRKNKLLNVLLDKKIRERTNELETNRNDLLNIVKHQELVLRRVSAGVGDRISTLKGLCFTALEDLSDPLALTYIDKIKDTSWQLDGYLRSVFVEAKPVKS